jgi:hypothetical protein
MPAAKGSARTPLGPILRQIMREKNISYRKMLALDAFIVFLRVQPIVVINHGKIFTKDWVTSRKYILLI